MSAWDPLSWEVLIDVLVTRYGWVMIFALIVCGVARRSPRTLSTCRRSGRLRFRRHPATDRRWYHLPVLCWALVSARQHLELWDSLVFCQSPYTAETFWITAYESALGLCCVCAVQIAGLTAAGEPAHSLGTTGYRRAAMVSALLAVTMDMFVFLWAASPILGVRFS